MRSSNEMERKVSQESAEALQKVILAVSELIVRISANSPNEKELAILPSVLTAFSSLIQNEYYT